MRFILPLITSCLLLSCHRESPPHLSGAAHAMHHWYYQRSYPKTELDPNNYLKSYAQHQALAQDSRFTPGHRWESLGPDNIGGRTLCLAFDPEDPDKIYAGSASGGLWVSSSAGDGADAWDRIETGHPVSGVAAIAIDPTDGNTLLIGTGEVYNLPVSRPGTVNRLTRGTYGIGLLKSTDGGTHWNIVLGLQDGDLRGIQDIKINPTNPNEIYAATTDGIWRSLDTGDSWTQVLDVGLCTDIEFDGSIIYITGGDFSSPGFIYNSTDGTSWNNLTDNLPSFLGKAMLAVDPSRPGRVYVDVADPFNAIGLYVTETQGGDWSLINRADVARFQGWYAHDVWIDPTDPRQVIQVGVDLWRSSNGGFTMDRYTDWRDYRTGVVNPNGPEGTTNTFIHADIHRIYSHPLRDNHIYVACDGGVFMSPDRGDTWQGRNGGYTSSQFYANLGVSATDSTRMTGGLQDNYSCIYNGNRSWNRIFGGDGGSAAVHPRDEDVLFISSQFSNILRSDNGGANLISVSPPVGNSAFIGPYALAPSHPDTIYAGGTVLAKSLDRGNSWEELSDTGLGARVVNALTVDPSDANIILYASYSLSLVPSEPAGLFYSDDGGQTAREITGLPDIIIMDIAIDPSDGDHWLVVLGGYGVDHVWESYDQGASWIAIDANLPDAPVTSVLIDPLIPQHLYVGTDIGVYARRDRNTGIWMPLTEGLPDANLCIDLQYSPMDRTIRLATHGAGIWKAPMLEEIVSTTDASRELEVIISPNPSTDIIRIQAAQVDRYRLVDPVGRVHMHGKLIDGDELSIEPLSAGTYYIQLWDRTDRSLGVHAIQLVD